VLAALHIQPLFWLAAGKVLKICQQFPAQNDDAHAMKIELGILVHQVPFLTGNVSPDAISSQI
jgi:hypothetical protein